VIGKYLFENNLDKDYIELLKINPEEIRKEGKSILKKAIEYVLKSL